MPFSLDVLNVTYQLVLLGRSEAVRMESRKEAVREAISELNALVAKDGGSLTLQRHDETEDLVKVKYAMGVNEECDTCSITPDMMEMFLAESFRIRGAEVARIVIEPPVASSDDTTQPRGGQP